MIDLPTPAPQGLGLGGAGPAQLGPSPPRSHLPTAAVGDTACRTTRYEGRCLSGDRDHPPHPHPMKGWAASSSQENPGTLEGACTCKRLKPKHLQSKSVPAFEFPLG